MGELVGTPSELATFYGNEQSPQEKGANTEYL